MNDVTARPNSLPWPPIIFLAAIAVSILLGTIYPLPWFAQPLSGILSTIGWLMIAAFVALNVSAIRAMRRAGTTVRPDRGTDHLVMEGPFSFTRNPLYLAGTTLVLGIGLVSGIVWFLLLAVLAAFAVQKLAIEREERHLQARFGKTYVDYAERVRRWRAKGRRHRVVVAAVAHQRRRRDAGGPLLAGFQRHGGQIPERVKIGGKPRADGLGVTTSAITLSSNAALRQHGVKIVEARCHRDRRHEVRARILHQALDLAFFVTLAGPSEAVPEQVMAHQFRERPRPFPFAVAANLRHRDLQIVIEHRRRHSAEEGEGRHVAVQECLRRLGRIGLHEAGIRLRQVHAEEVELATNTTDHANRFAKIHLRMAWRMRQRHERLATSCPRDADVVLHHRVATVEPVFVAQPLEDPLRGVPLLHRTRAIRLQDRVDHREQRAKLRLRHRPRARIARRQREPAHLQHCLAAQPEYPGRLTTAVALDKNERPDGSIDFHGKHPDRPPKGSA